MTDLNLEEGTILGLADLPLANPTMHPDSAEVADAVGGRILADARPWTTKGALMASLQSATERSVKYAKEHVEALRTAERSLVSLQVSEAHRHDLVKTLNILGLSTDGLPEVHRPAFEKIDDSQIA